MGERVWECGASLNGRESELADIVWVVKPKDSFDLVVVYVLLYSKDIRVQVLDIFNVWEYEGFLRVESKCNNIFDVLMSHFNNFL